MRSGSVIHDFQETFFLWLKEPPEAMILEPPEANAAGQQQSPLEALLSGHGNFPAMFIPPDADDETMVELAIALSLQDQVFVYCTFA